MPNTREKLIELLTEYFGVDPAYYGVEAQHFADHLIANGVTVQKWIPVTERLPEDTEMVLIYSEIGNQYVAQHFSEHPTGCHCQSHRKEIDI